MALGDPHVCPYCRKGYKQRYYLDKHVEKKHGYGTIPVRYMPVYRVGFAS